MEHLFRKDVYYIFNTEERAAFLREEPDAEPYLRPFVGSREFLQGGERWMLRLANVAPQVLRTLPNVRGRIAAVRAYRLASREQTYPGTCRNADALPVNVVPTAPFLVIPKVSSERREYVPIGWLEPPVIPSDLVFIVEDASKPLFALLTSATHMAWLRHIGGRLKSDYRTPLVSCTTLSRCPCFRGTAAAPRTLCGRCPRRPCRPSRRDLG